MDKNKFIINPRNELITYGIPSLSTPFDLNAFVNNTKIDPVNVIKISFGESHTLLLFSIENKTYLAGYGNNESGQLGLEWSSFHDSQIKYDKWIMIDIEKYINSSSAFWNKSEFIIKDIAAGSDYSIILIEFIKEKTQCLYRFAFQREEKYDFISMVDDPLQKKCPIHMEIFPYDKGIKKIECYNERILVLMNDNSLYIKGVLYDMSYSLKKYRLYTELPVDIDDMVMGINHTLFLGKDNVIYCLGHNEYSEFGMEDETDGVIEAKGEIEAEGAQTKILKQQTFFKDNKLLIEKITTGGRHTLVLCQGGKVYCFGDNSDRQCYEYDKVISQPTIVNFISEYPIIDICCGVNHSLAKNSQGDIFAWGDPSKGKLGINENTILPSNPIEITSLKTRNISQMFAGKNESIFFIKIHEDSSDTKSANSQQLAEEVRNLIRKPTY